MAKTFARVYLCDGSLDPDDVKKRFRDANVGSVVQTSRPDPSENEFFFEMLAAQTLRAKALGSLLAKKPEIDFLLRLAGTTQISRAIKQKGAARGERFLVVVAGRSDPRPKHGEGLRRLQRGELTRSELGRIERAALLSAQRP